MNGDRAVTYYCRECFHEQLQFGTCENCGGSEANLLCFDEEGRFMPRLTHLLCSYPGVRGIEQSMRLEAAEWEDGLLHLAAYIEREGNASVPAEHREGGFPLGRWVRNQRALQKRTQLDPGRVARLEALPVWVWDLGEGNQPANPRFGPRGGWDLRGHTEGADAIASDRHILAWWDEGMDEWLLDVVRRYRWWWACDFYSRLVEKVGEPTLKRWAKADPLTRTWVHYNLPTYFAQERLVRGLGGAGLFPAPAVINCFLCGDTFEEWSLECWAAKRLDYQPDLCADCVSAIIGGGGGSASGEEILRYIQVISELLQQVPPSDFQVGRNALLFSGVDPAARKEVLRVLSSRPSMTAVNREFGSWFNALVEAGVLEGGAQRMARGTRCLAHDGHLCHSLAEKTIDDMLTARGIAHDKEVPYPGDTGYRADWGVGSGFVEFFGMPDDPEYREKMDQKKRILRSARIPLVSILPADLVSHERMEKSIGEILVLLEQ